MKDLKIFAITVLFLLVVLLTVRFASITILLLWLIAIYRFFDTRKEEIYKFLDKL